jgi:hypothetical protein
MIDGFRVKAALMELWEKEFLAPQLNAARERDVQATYVLTFNPGLPLAGDAAATLQLIETKFAKTIKPTRLHSNQATERY